MISVSEWIELMKMLGDPNSVINSKAFEKVREDVERFALECYPCAISVVKKLQGGANG